MTQLVDRILSLISIVKVNKLDKDLFVILALPLLVLTVNDEWIFNADFIDSWVYFGYFLNLPDHLRTFAGTYYGSRLSWILPGYLAYQLFPPLIANYVLHLGFYYLAVISLYLTLKYTLGHRSALLTAILMGYYPNFWWAVGWDYVDGAGLAYFLLTMLLLTCAVKFSWWRTALYVGGLSFAALIHSNIFWVVFFPVFGLYYLLANHKYRRNPQHWSLLIFALGFIGLTVLLGAINYIFTQDFLFFWPSVSFSLKSIREPNPWKAPSYAWLRTATWLVFPVFTLMASLAFFLRQRILLSVSLISFDRLFLLTYILIASILLAFELRGNPVLQHQYYASYLIPGMFLAIGSLVGARLSHLNEYQFTLLVGSTIFVPLIPFVLLFTLTSILTILDLKDNVGLLVLVISLFGLSIFLFKPTLNAKWLILVLVCFSVANVMMIDDRLNPDIKGDNLQPKTRYLAILEGFQTVQALDLQNNVHFWYDEMAPLGAIYQSVASTYLWGYRLINTRFPSLDDNWQRLNPGTKVAILSNDFDTLQKASEALNQYGYEVRLIAEKKIKVENIAYVITFVEVTVSRDRFEAEPFYVAADFMNNWATTGAAQAVVVAEQDRSAKITTNYSAYDWQIVSAPIVVRPTVEHLVAFELDIEQGGVGVHIVGADRQSVLTSHYWCHSAGQSTHREFNFDSGNNAEISIVISNCGHPQPTISVFQIKDLKVWSGKTSDR